MASLDSVNLDQVVDYRAEYTAVIQKYKITGDNLVGLCPFHQDRNDSFSVDLKTGRWHCFAEDEGGNFVTFWAKYQGIDTKEAYKEILARYGITPEHERQAQQTNASGLGSYTLERYSFDKRLPADFLRDTCRVDTGRDRDGTEYLRMPYYFEDGKEAAIRKRYAKKEFRWMRGSKGKICLYGEWKLPGIRKAGYAVLVEGESDTQTLWYLGIPAIGITCTNPQVTNGVDCYFRICFLDPFQGTVLANFASKEFGAKKAYCLSKLGDDYSGGLCHYFVEAFKALGGEVVEETFPEGNSDFTSYITTAQNSGAEVFFSPVSTEAAALIIDQAAGNGMTMPILAGDTWDSNVITGAAKGKNVKVCVTTFFDEGAESEAAQAFVSGIKEWINSDATAKANNGGNDMISAVTAMGYDSYFTALEALKNAGSTNPADVLKALPTTTYEGVTGAIAFDEIGDAIRDAAFVKEVDTATGEWKFVAIQGVN